MKSEMSKSESLTLSSLIWLGENKETKGIEGETNTNKHINGELQANPYTTVTEKSQLRYCYKVHCCSAINFIICLFCFYQEFP